MRPAERQDAPQPQNGMGRMVVVSAALHVLIVVLVVLMTSRRPSESSPGLTAYTVELVNPGVLGPTRGGGGKGSPVTPSSAEPIPPSQRPEVKEPPAAKRPPAPPREEPAKMQLKEPPPSKQQATSKEIEPPKSKEPPPAKAPEPPKVAMAKPLPQEPPAVKPKAIEPVKPKEVVKLLEKSKKVEPKPQLQPTEKKPTEPVKPQTKNSTTEKNQEKKPTETERKLEKPAPPPQKSESSPTVNTKEKKTENEEKTTGEHEKQILAAVEKIRATEEATRREQDIAAAVDRVRQKVPEKGEGKPSDHEAPRSPRQDGEANGKTVDEGNPGGGYGAEFFAYTQHIKQRVKEAWIVTERKPGLSAVVRFGVGATGEVLDVELAESSGDLAFDQTVLRAVKKANPLPPPPEAYRDEFLTQKVEITFSGEERIK